MTKVGVFLAKIVAIVNQKGGVGKTTTCVNLTSSLKEKGNRVLLCDFDPQANSTSGMGVDKAASRGVYDVLITAQTSRPAWRTRVTATCSPLQRHWRARASR